MTKNFAAEGGDSGVGPMWSSMGKTRKTMLPRVGSRSDLILVRLSRLETYWLGKVFTYLLNAQTDCRIAEALLCYVKEGRYPTGMTEVELRARDLINSLDKDARTAGQVALAAYTIERVNGLADYLFAHLLARFLAPQQQGQVEQFLKNHAVHHATLAAFCDDIVSWSSIIAIGTRILSGDHQDIDRYDRKHRVTLCSAQNELFQMLLLVQKRNIQANARTAHCLRANAEPASRKVWAIRRAAKGTPHPQAFIRAAVRTQKAASQWDQFFAWLIQLKSRVSANAWHEEISR